MDADVKVIVECAIREFATMLSQELDLNMKVLGGFKQRFYLSEWNDVYGFSWVDINVCICDYEQLEFYLSRRVPDGYWHSFESSEEVTWDPAAETSMENLPKVWVEASVRDKKHKMYDVRYAIVSVVTLSKDCLFNEIKSWLDDIRTRRFNGKESPLADGLKVINAMRCDRVDYDFEGKGDYVLVRANGKLGLVEFSGGFVCDVKYDSIGDAAEGLIPVQIAGKWGYINNKGEEVIPLRYDSVYPFAEGVAKVKLEGKWGCINSKGEDVTPSECDDLPTLPE